MTTTPTLREVAQQALEALAPLANATTPAEREALTDADAQAADAASCDLRAALAEQAASALLERAVALHEEAGMPWADAETLALREFGVGADAIAELVGECTSSRILVEGEITAFAISVLVHGSALLALADAAAALAEQAAEQASPAYLAEPGAAQATRADLVANWPEHNRARMTVALHYAAPAAEQAEPLPAEYDVRTILLGVVPGDGSGREVYAKSVNDVHAVLTRMGERIEELESRLAVPAAEQAGAIPAGWVPLRMEWEPGYPEDVAFGPPMMMERLKKWLDKHFAARVAEANAEQAEPVAQTSAEWERRFLAYDPSSDPAEAECDIPPHGWRCTRAKGHDGPCAAVAAPDDVALVRRSMARLAAAEQAEPVAYRTDGMPASASERYLRRLLAYRTGILGAYYDDGEAQGQEHGISIDFMREPVADIDAKLRALNVARASFAAPPAPALQEPLFLLHTGQIDSGGEQDEWDIEANSWVSVEEFCRAHPGQTIGLNPQPLPAAPITAAPAEGGA